MVLRHLNRGARRSRADRKTREEVIRAQLVLLVLLGMTGDAGVPVLLVVPVLPAVLVSRSVTRCAVVSFIWGRGYGGGELRRGGGGVVGMCSHETT